MKISSKDKTFDKGATMQKLLVVPALGLLLAGCNPADGTATSVASNDGFSLYCPNVGIAADQCILSDPENPYAGETVDDTTKYTFAAAAANERDKFYVWATAQANSQSGENQYYTALSLQELYDANANASAQAQAKLAYKSVLDNYFDASAGESTPGAPISNVDLSETAFDMGTGGGVNAAYAGDSSFANAIQATPGGNWGAAAAAVAWENLTPGFAANYTTLEFKVKDVPTANIYVKLDNGDVWPNYTGEKAFALATYGTAITGASGWYQVSIPVSEFDGAEDVAPLLGIHSGYGNGGTILVTDVVFKGDATGSGLVGDTADGAVYLYSSTGASVDLTETAFDMGTGGGVDAAYTGDSSFANAIQASPGGNWGASAAGVAWENLTAGFAANYTTLEFKVKDVPTANIYVKLDNGDVWPNYTGEKAFALSSYGSEISGADGWYQVSIPVSEFDGAEDVAPLLGIHSGYGNGGTILVTDVVFKGDATGSGLVGDTVGDGIITMYKSDTVSFASSKYRDLVGENLVEPDGMDNLYDDAAAATTALSGWGFSYDTATNTLTAD